MLLNGRLGGRCSLVEDLGEGGRCSLMENLGDGGGGGRGVCVCVHL